MKFLVFTFLFCIASYTVAQQPFTCKGQNYLSLTKDRSSVSGLYEVKFSQNGQSVVLDTIAESVGLILNGMGYRSTDNFIYGMDPFTGRLRRVGMDGHAIDLGLPLGLPPGALYYAGDITPDGKFLVLVTSGTITPQLVKIDMESPVYQCQVLPLVDKTISVVDVAFDPFTGVLYGNDIRNQRLITINIETGTINNNFLIQTQVDQLGALFFDSFGNLYGYGSYNSLVADKLVAINKKTGLATLLAQGPASIGQDGCSCPFTIELQKIVTPEVAYPCTEVVYSIIVSNGSGVTRNGIELLENVPAGLILKSVISNPFGGQVSVTGNRLKIENMSVRVGIDTIKVLVEIGSDALGLYKSQAILSGLPITLGKMTLSDNPKTTVENDSTALLVKPLDVSFVKNDYFLKCGESLLIDVSLDGLNFLWSDGDTSSKKVIKESGMLTLLVSSACDSRMVNINVELENSASITLQTIAPESIKDTLCLNDYTKAVKLQVKTTGFDNNAPPEFSFSENGVKIDQSVFDPTKSGVGKFVIKAETFYKNCLVSDSITFTVLECFDCKYVEKLPTLIVPETNDINSTLRFNNIADQAGENELWIYNRWGQQIYHSRNYENEWKADGQLSGVYYYVLKACGQVYKRALTVLK